MTRIMIIALLIMTSSAAQAAFKPCPNGVVGKKTCECRAVVSGHRDICHPGQHCIRHAFSGMCR
jgi:hypothetical protein